LERPTSKPYTCIMWLCWWFLSLMVLLCFRLEIDLNCFPVWSVEIFSFKILIFYFWLDGMFGCWGNIGKSNINQEFSIRVVFMGIEVYWVLKRQSATVFFSLQLFCLSFLFLILTRFDLMAFGVLLEIFGF
jgi:hypothetical protein